MNYREAKELIKKIMEAETSDEYLDHPFNEKAIIQIMSDIRRDQETEADFEKEFL